MIENFEVKGIRERLEIGEILNHRIGVTGQNTRVHLKAAARRRSCPDARRQWRRCARSAACGRARKNHRRSGWRCCWRFGCCGCGFLLLAGIVPLPADEFDSLRLRWRDMLTFGTNSNPADTDYSAWISSVGMDSGRVVAGVNADEGGSARMIGEGSSAVDAKGSGATDDGCGGSTLCSLASEGEPRRDAIAASSFATRAVNC